MDAESIKTGPPVTGAPTRRRALWALALLLAGLVVYAVVRETAVRPALHADAAGTGQHPAMDADGHPVPVAPVRQALTPAEERYASDLWTIHSQVKADAVKVTFAGIAYKMGDIDKAKVRERVAPLTQAYSDALTRASAISPPQNLATLHSNYVDAIRAYRDATMEMVKVADDGSDAHLIAAQDMTEKAARVLLKASDTLWPGEYKPN